MRSFFISLQSYTVAIAALIKLSMIIRPCTVFSTIATGLYVSVTSCISSFMSFINSIFFFPGSSLLVWCVKIVLLSVSSCLLSSSICPHMNIRCLNPAYEYTVSQPRIRIYGASTPHTNIRCLNPAYEYTVSQPRIRIYGV